MTSGTPQTDNTKLGNNPQPEQASDKRSPQTSGIFLSVVIPAYNESTRLPKSLRTVIEYLESKGTPYEVLVVDDGSSDDTAALAEQFAQATPLATPHSTLHVIRNPHRGKGYAVRTGMLAAQGKYVLYSDADFSAPIEEVEKLLKYLEG